MNKRLPIQQFSTDLLGEREQTVLQTIIREYIQYSEPVGSRNVSKVGPLRMSPATIRNIMGELEDKGYIVQPHTSAGRVPTDRGYRYYIDHLAEVDLDIKDIEEHIQNTFAFEVPNMASLMKEFSKRLGMLTQSVGFVATPHMDSGSISQIEFVRLADNTAICIAITKSGIVKNIMLHLDKAVSSDDLLMMSNYINSQLSEMSVDDLLNKLLGELNKNERELKKILSNLALAEAEAYDSNLIFEGAANILDFPEFKDTNTLKSLLSAMDEKKKISEILGSCLGGQGVQIFVGKEIGLDIDELGLVTSAYKKNGKIVGVVGVLGPKRMEYGRVISVVNYSSHMMEQIIKQLHGGFSE